TPTQTPTPTVRPTPVPSPTPTATPVPIPTPVISAVSPAFGPYAGGTNVGIDGANFISPVALALDGQSVTPTAVSVSRIAFATPPKPGWNGSLAPNSTSETPKVDPD